MSDVKRAGRVGAVLWSVGLSVVILACGISVLLPSTKRARIHLPIQSETSTTDEAATAPTSQSATQPESPGPAKVR